jgi:hypothetical protein
MKKIFIHHHYPRDVHKKIQKSMHRARMASTMNRCLWRLHPPPNTARRSPERPSRPSPPSPSCGGFDFDLGDDAYIRPKSVKELGISGRIIGMTHDGSTMTAARTAAAADEKTTAVVGGTNDVNDDIAPAAGHHILQRRAGGRKRVLVEDVRYSIQRHCSIHHRRIIGANDDCGHVKTGIRPSRLFPVYDKTSMMDEEQKTHRRSSTTLVLVTPDTTNYRLLASSHVRANDVVLEIGCSTGECTALVLRRLALLHMNPCRLRRTTTLRVPTEGDGEGGGAVVGGDDDDDVIIPARDNDIDPPRCRIIAFDIGSDMIEKAKERTDAELRRLLAKDDVDDNIGIYDGLVNFRKIDAMTDPRGALAHATMYDDDCRRGPDVVLIDIGGNRELDAVVRMIRWVRTSFGNGTTPPPRLIIVKSEALVDELMNTSTTPPKDGESDGELISVESKEDRSGRDIGKVRPIVMENGMIEHAEGWYESFISSLANEGDDVKSSGSKKILIPKYSHPTKAPLVLSPKDDATPICRWHNYHPAGCKRFASGRCPYDHDHCHWCRAFGHVAIDCAG